jgi:hypothetical protein
MSGDNNDVQFGRLLGIMEMVRAELAELKQRFVFRIDNLESRVEKLEVGHAAESVYVKVVEKATWAVLGGAIAVAARYLLPMVH